MPSGSIEGVQFRIRLIGATLPKVESRRGLSQLRSRSSASAICSGLD